MAESREGDQQQIEAARSLLNSLDPQSRKKLVGEVFIDEFGKQISPSTRDELSRILEQSTQGRAVAAPDIVSPQSPEQRADILLQHVDKVEYLAFQMYGFEALKTGNTFIYRRKEAYDHDEASDPFEYTPGEKPHSPSSKIIRACRRLMGFENPREFGNEIDGDLFCVVGEKNGKTIVEGGGRIDFDPFGRVNSNAFQITFSNPEFANTFTQWLQASPNEALHHTLARAIGEYDTNGNFKQTATLIQNSDKPYGQEVNLFEPFRRPIKKVHLLDMGTRKTLVNEVPQK